jgi:hypothetical protein
MTEMIPISEIDSLIAEVKARNDADFEVELGGLVSLTEYRLLQKIKQKAIPAVTIEKIDARIKELHQWQKDFPSGKEWHQELIDELEDLKKE